MIALFNKSYLLYNRKLETFSTIFLMRFMSILKFVICTSISTCQFSRIGIFFIPSTKKLILYLVQLFYTYHVTQNFPCTRAQFLLNESSITNVICNSELCYCGRFLQTKIISIVYPFRLFFKFYWQHLSNTSYLRNCMQTLLIRLLIYVILCKGKGLQRYAAPCITQEAQKRTQMQTWVRVRTPNMTFVKK